MLVPAHAAQFAVSWNDTATNEDGFKLERKTGIAGTYTLLATLGADTTGYVDGTVTAGTTYCYRARAYNSAGDSAYSNEGEIGSCYTEFQDRVTYGNFIELLKNGRYRGVDTRRISRMRPF